MKTMSSSQTLEGLVPEDKLPKSENDQSNNNENQRKNFISNKT